jgi:5-methylcytosine-specific restriction protein A
MPKLPMTQAEYDGKPNYKKQYDRDRGSSTERGYDRKWRKVRKAFLSRNPLCKICLEGGITKEARVVHHIIPIDQGGDRLRFNNLMALCRDCHEKIHKRF